VALVYRFGRVVRHETIDGQEEIDAELPVRLLPRVPGIVQSSRAATANTRTGVGR
jgi:hypothetical protein